MRIERIEAAADEFAAYAVRDDSFANAEQAARILMRSYTKGAPW